MFVVLVGTFHSQAWDVVVPNQEPGIGGTIWQVDEQVFQGVQFDAQWSQVSQFAQDKIPSQHQRIWKLAHSTIILLSVDVAILSSVS